MKYTYKIYEGPLNTLMIELPEKISLVADLLEDDIHSNHGIQYLDKVLNKELDFLEVSGNSCNLEIKEDYTKIIYRFYEDGENTCEIETVELKNLMLVWLAEYENYLRNRDSN